MNTARMKLYCSVTSPYSRKVRVVLQELQLAGQTEEVIADPFNPTPEFLAANPLSKIPALVTEKGEALLDSSLIVEYLQTRGHGLLLLPKGSKRWAPLRRAQIAEGMIDAAVAMVMEKRRPESIVFTSFLDRQVEIIRRCVQSLNVAADLLSREQPTVVEVTTAVGLAYLDFRLPYLEWRKAHEALAAWYADFSQRPSMIATAPPQT